MAMVSPSLLSADFGNLQRDVEMLNQSELQGIVKLTRNLLLGTFIIEGIGALILSLRFMTDYSPLKLL